MLTSQRIAVLGTGYLGATHAACMADLGHQVLGVDTDDAKLAKLRSGELPFYDVDTGPNYSKINAALVREIGDTDRSVLLEKLAETAGELEAFLRAVAPEEWDRDFGVRHRGEGLTAEYGGDDVITVKSTVDDLIADYDHHRAQLEQLRRDAV